MLNSFTWILIGSMIALAAMQLLFIVWYRRILLHRETSKPDSSLETSLASNPSVAPKVAIVLCLRGPDPTLNDCLTGLLNQRYPNFELHLILDSDVDPVIPIARSALQAIPSSVKTHWHTVTDHSSNRSLKCSALITAVIALQEKQKPPEIVAFVDADALVAPDWLIRLVSPLMPHQSFNDPENNKSTVGATTGNRWFEPVDGNLGSRFRAAWNAAALPQMQIYQVAWGGSLALRLDTIERCDLLDRWSQAFCEDTMLADVLQNHNLHVHRVPDLIVVNQESTTLKAAVGWIGRQLLTVRLYHRAWPFILLHALLGGFCFFAPLVLAMVTVIENRPLAILLVAAWAMQLVFNIGLLEFIRKINFSAINQSAPKSANASGIFSKPFVAIVLQAIYPFLAIGAAFRQRTRWRGIDYRIGRRGKIGMLDYVPYSQLNQPDKHSID